jgi:hypothetical protein
VIAALYVERRGVYCRLRDVDLWDERRDARLYAGPWPVVAHPPCRTWCRMSLCRPEIPRGEDGGGFEAALEAVRTFGGVLEHPAYSLAWREFSLPQPPGAGWATALGDPGWSCEVDQRHYGHRARKPTWLYAVGVEPVELKWGPGPPGRRIANSHHGDGTDRSGTPRPFRDLLLDMARSARAEAAA